MVTLDLSNWLSDWLSHFISSGVVALLAFWLMWITLSGLFKRVGFRPRLCATWSQRVVALGMITTSLSAAAFWCFAVHWLQDFCWGPFIAIEFVWRIL